MKKLLTLLILPLAFITNVMAQELEGWIKDPTIRETHWFGQYEYLDQSPLNFLSRTINWSGNYLESIVIVKDWTNQNPPQTPKTSYYSWLDHKLRFSVDNTGGWSIDGSNYSAYSAVSSGQGLRNSSDQAQNFYIHNLKSGDEYTVTYYLDYNNQALTINGRAVGTATVSIPSGAVIRCVEIKLAEYVASDFKVDEVSGDFVSNLTNSHKSFLNGQGVSNAQFGDIGYRYTFKGPGVLEDKRGAVPYITMKFGNDNDMTFVRALTEVVVQYGALTETEAKLYTKENAGDPVLATGDEFEINSYQNAAEDWDAQFFITAPYALSTDQQFTVEFDYKAQHATSKAVESQAHRNAGDYIWYECIGTFDFTDEWKHFKGTTTVSSNMNGMQTIAFNLSGDRDNNTFYFKNIKLSVPERTEIISEGDLGAASIIHEDNDLNPDDGHLQYRWTYKDSNYGQNNGRFSEAEIRDRFVGKEWSTFTALEDPTHQADPTSNGSVYDYWGNYQGDYIVNGINYVYGDNFPSIWPLCGNFFYFFPEVDGLLEIEYYCEGSYETNAFWYKQDPEGNQMTVNDQPKVQYINSNGQNSGNQTDGNNNYKMMVNVVKGGIYYLCSLPTNLTHERPIFRLKSYTFIPRFRVAPLYKVVHNSEVNTEKTKGVAEIIGGPYRDLNGGTDQGSNNYELSGTFIRNAEEEVRVKCLGNVASATAKMEMIDGKQKLSFYNIKFKQGDNVNPGGAIVAHVNNQVGQASFVLTIAYDAAPAKWNDTKDTRVAATSGGKEVKHWDFYSNTNWDLGQYGEDDGTRYADNPNAWKDKSKLFKETHKADGLTADWEYDWVDVPNRIEPLFKSIYDMEADNADMIHETEGLVFFTEPNELGIYNENGAPTSSFQDRFIGLMGGGKLIIPRLNANDRVVIKMGCFGNCDENASNSELEQKAVLTLTNAKDAKGNDITDDYIIGGSIPYDDETSPANTLPHGEYHFLVASDSNSDDTDFAIELKEGALLKIYSIDIYRNAANENADILTENSVTSDTPELLIAEGEGSKDMEFFMRYRGYEEKSDFSGDADQVRGNLALTSSSFTADDTEGTISATFNEGDFGSFRAEMAVRTKDAANTYVTDYAPGTLAVGYLETMDYPYTWDFTDLSSYVSEDISDEEESETLDEDFKGWEGSALRSAPEEEPGILFANGGQLYASDALFAEAAGIGFKRSIADPEQAKTFNNGVTVEDGGLVLNSTNGFYKLVLPTVEADAAIYIRATATDGATAQYSTDGETGNEFTPVSAEDGDIIYAMQNSAEQDIELWLNGMTVKKIAVSVDNKSLDINGWASESRERVIDPALTAYMTGSNIQTLFVTGVDYTNMAINLAAADLNDDGQVLCALEDGDFGACLLYNADGPVEILNGGFHLFVPDMHDYSATGQSIKTATTNEESVSLLKAQVSANPIADVVGDYTNYVLSNTRYINGQGEPQNSPEGFYRVKPGGINTNGHKAYLQLLTDEVKASTSAFSIVFDSNSDGINEVVDTDATNKIYNINGMKLNRMPTTTGLYIVNGKKVVIK